MPTPPRSLAPRWQDPESLVRAAALLSHRSDLIFRIWGDGPERARLEQLAAQLGVASRVQFMGATDEPERALAQMHVFAYPTTGVHSPA